MNIADIDVAVLAGGLGTRLRGILSETPKVLAPVGGQPWSVVVSLADSEAYGPVHNLSRSLAVAGKSAAASVNTAAKKYKSHLRYAMTSRTTLPLTSVNR